VDPHKAELATRTFRYHLEDPSTTKMAERLDYGEDRSEARLRKSGKGTASAGLTTQSVGKILLNEVYLGAIRFSGESPKASRSHLQMSQTSTTGM
jgi:hypothetical protein